MEHLAWPFHSSAASNTAAARFAAALCATPTMSTQIPTQPTSQAAVALSEQASLVSGSSTPRKRGKRVAESAPGVLVPASSTARCTPPKRARTSAGAAARNTDTSVASDSGAAAFVGVGVATLSASASASVGTSLGTSLGTSFGDVSGLSNSPVKSHTRRCREKVNEKFARLLEALPTAPAGVEVKHKAQILEYAIRVFRALLARRNALRIDIALASRTSLVHWATQRPLNAFASLYARKHHWPYAETWRFHANAAPSIEAVHDEPYAAQLRALGRMSTPAMAHGPCGVVARVAACRRAEWLPLVGADPAALARAETAAAFGVKIVFAVPIIANITTAREHAPSDTTPTSSVAITPPGTVLGVFLFFDTQCRAYDTRTVEEATEFASIIADTHVRTCTSPSYSEPQDATTVAVAVAK